MDMGLVNTEFFVRRELCPVCASAGGTTLYSCPMTADPVRSYIASHYQSQGSLGWSALEGTDFTVVKCEQCDLLYQQAQPTGEMFDYVYNRMVAPEFLNRIERERLTLDNFHDVANELTSLFRLADKHPSEISFLDFGFGYGRWARVARALGATVYATETGEEKVAAAAAIGVQVIDDDEIDTRRFDIVHTEQVLEHLAEPGRDFRRLATATAGIFKVAVPPRRNLEALLLAEGMAPVSAFERMMRGERLSSEDHAHGAIQPLEHLNAFSASTIQWLANHNNLEIVSRGRRRAVTVDPQASALVRSAISIGKMAAKAMLRRDDGYYVLRPRAVS